MDLGLLRPYANTAKDGVAALGDAATPEDRIGVAILAADERRLATAYAEARAGYEEAVRLATAMSRPDLAARAHLGAAQTLVWMVSSSEDISAFIAHSDEGERLFRQVGDAGGEIEVGIVALEALWSRGEVDTFIERGRALRERARLIGDNVRELLICARLVSSTHEEESAEYAARVDTLVAQLGARRPPWSRLAPCSILRKRGDLGSALRCYAEFEDLARVEQDPLLLLVYLRNTVEIVAIEQRRYPDARALGERAVQHSVRLGEWWNRVELIGTLAVATAGVGDIARADELLGEAASGLAGDVFATAYLAYCSARVHELAGRIDDAYASYRQAADRFEATGFRRMFWSALIRLDHAQLLQAHGRTVEAAERLASAEAILGEQRGERAERIAALRQAITKVGSTS
jgi:tetratricopeptide (TPR) repeat protein